MTATTTAAPPTVADLVLVRLALPARTPPAPSVVRRDVGRLLRGRPLADDEFLAARDELAAAGSVEVVKRGAVRPTEAGRERAREVLAVEAFPPRTTWQTVRAKYLFPRAAGLSAEAAGRLKTGDQLAAFALRRKYGLPAGAGESLTKALEALACREAGHPEETSVEGLYRAVLSRVIRSDVKLTRGELKKQFPRVLAGAPRAAADAFRTQAVRSWLGPARPEPPPAEFDLSAFAETVKALARVSPAEDRFHDNKAYIAAVWRSSQREPGFPRLDLPAFKAKLVEANRAGLLALSRADEIPSMPSGLVAESEAEYLNVTFHFVLIEGVRP